ncbi:MULTISPECIES: hypothetical protein [unclassified Pseudomonas]|uniref:hypothetical protein n=1 Tax=unclassified Pseudomonas TaxID=196821 RepID=UPI0024499054|nr:MULTISPECIES: hypothetical protein [unclassified Pseudomonas]MDH0893247.1 hypothetical protein [Pseudomonas sp. GD03875]MDH1064247.1 hypothetical protein [Pseudomonas sp. GD03985]
MPGQRGLLLSATLFNWAVGGGLILALPLVERLLALEPVAAGARVFVDLFAVLVIAFGCAYLMLAIDFRQYRPFALLGAGAKLAVVATVLAHYLAGNVGWQLPALASIDLLYALLFIALLRASQGTSP